MNTVADPWTQWYQSQDALISAQLSGDEIQVEVCRREMSQYSHAIAAIEDAEREARRMVNAGANLQDLFNAGNWFALARELTGDDSKNAQWLHDHKLLQYSSLYNEVKDRVRQAVSNQVTA